MAATRHRWDCQEVEVAWSPLPGHLYTCRNCGIQRQTVEDPPRHFRTLYGFPTADGTRRWDYSDRTPPCPGPTPEGCLTAMSQLGLYAPPADHSAPPDPTMPKHAPAILRAVLAEPEALTFREIAARCAIEHDDAARACVQLEALGLLERVDVKRGKLDFLVWGWAEGGEAAALRIVKS